MGDRRGAAIVPAIPVISGRGESWGLGGEADARHATAPFQRRLTTTPPACPLANQKIVQVDQTAAAANEAAASARTVADSAANKAAAVEVASKRIVYEVTLSEDQGNFKFSQAELPAEAKARIDEVVKQLKATPNGACIEVEGYTDSRGAKAYNQQLGLDRAESVKRYLHQEHQIPLHRINVISYGSDRPIAPNTTKAGRAQNRRVVIRVLA